MAKREDTTSKLILKVIVGQTVDGKDKYAQRVFRNLDPDITDDALYSLGGKLGRLQTNTVAAIVRQDASSIVAE
ncbi:Protein of unknown function [Selenomonas sp. GACV-9]|uniref:DUF1659 domain-containing protein n=1 Tax=Selenomonas sp. GACV-9 TaxID=3158782 RepID=UPI0008F1EDF5|nr:Protein of unknown function [Selenomonas ruminantium]